MSCRARSSGRLSVTVSSDASSSFAAFWRACSSTSWSSGYAWDLKDAIGTLVEGEEVMIQYVRAANNKDAAVYRWVGGGGFWSIS